MIVTWPTLEEYVLLSKRTTTPIYPGDAQCIVNLLDLHVTAPPNIPSTAAKPASADTSEASSTSDILSSSSLADAPLTASSPYPPPSLGPDVGDPDSNSNATSTVKRAIKDDVTPNPTLHPHPARPVTAAEYSPMEILEIGTGHGSLTLHLARAIHAS